MAVVNLASSNQMEIPIDERLEKLLLKGWKAESRSRLRKNIFSRNALNWC